MKVVHKYPLEHGTYNRLYCDKIIHFGATRSGTVCVWGEADPDNIQAKWEVCIIGTGWDIPEGLEHFGSCIEGAFVWHLYGRKL